MKDRHSSRRSVRVNLVRIGSSWHLHTSLLHTTQPGQIRPAEFGALGLLDARRVGPGSTTRSVGGGHSHAERGNEGGLLVGRRGASGRALPRGAWERGGLAGGTTRSVGEGVPTRSVGTRGACSWDDAERRGGRCHAERGNEGGLLVGRRGASGRAFPRGAWERGGGRLEVISCRDAAQKTSSSNGTECRSTGTPLRRRGRVGQCSGPGHGR